MHLMKVFLMFDVLNFTKISLWKHQCRCSWKSVDLERVLNLRFLRALHEKFWLQVCYPKLTWENEHLRQCGHFVLQNMLIEVSASTLKLHHKLAVVNFAQPNRARLRHVHGGPECTNAAATR